MLGDRLEDVGWNLRACRVVEEQKTPRPLERWKPPAEVFVGEGLNAGVG
jgi:hypothetical protein